MKLHYMGKFNLDPNTLPQAEHKPGATEFKEADSMKKLAVIANAVSFVIFAVLAVAAYLRLPDITRGKSSVIAWGTALLGSLLILFPHELLHAVCFKNDVYLYTNFKQGMLFVVGTPRRLLEASFPAAPLLPEHSTKASHIKWAKCLRTSQKRTAFQ